MSTMTGKMLRPYKCTMLRKFSAALVLVLFFLALTTQFVSAHATLIKAEPAPNSLVAVAPQQIVLSFDEPIDLTFSTIEVYDQALARYDAARPSTLPGDPKQIRVPLKEMPDGTYSVAWKVLSAADGHITRGNYAFSVGKVTATIATTSESAASETAPFSIFARWLELFSILAFVGAIFFRETVLTYSLSAVETGNLAASASTPTSFDSAQDAGRGSPARNLQSPAHLAADTRWQQLAIAALGLAIVSELMRLGLQANNAADTLNLSGISQFLFDTRLGWIWLWRFMLVAMLGFILLRVKPRIAVLLSTFAFLLLTFLYFGGLGNDAPLDALGKIAGAFIASWNSNGVLHHLVVLGSPFLVFFVIGAYRDEKTRRFMLALLSLATLATLSLGGHAAALGDFSFALIADWLHLTAVSFWVGGLLAIVWVVTAVWRALTQDQARAWLGVLIPRFSFVALVSVGVILITGLYASFQQIPSLDALIQTLYGESLVVKIALFLVMVALGGFHLTVTTKRIHAPSILRDFRALVAFEAAIGALVIALAGFMTLSAPARATILATQYAQSQQPKPTGLVLFARPASDLNLSLNANATDNPQTFDALVTDANKQPAKNILRVIYEFTLLDQDIGATRVNVDTGSQGHYITSGNYLTFPGLWRVRVIVRRAGVDDIASEFPIYRESPSLAPTDPMALEFLKQGDTTMNALKAMRATEELNDGENGVVYTRGEFAAPDRVHTTVEGGSESIAIGATQYFHDDSGWTSLTRPEPYKFPSFNNAGLASSIRFGRAELMDGKPAQIVMVDFTSSAGDVHFAYWVGTDDRLIKQYAMVAPAHFMTEHYRDFNAAVEIAAPQVPSFPLVPSQANNGNKGNERKRLTGPITGDLQSDLAIGIFVVALLIGLRATDRERTFSSRIISAQLAGALVIAALLLFNDAINATYKQFSIAPIDSQQAASGQVLYQQNCLVCHGETGYGNGPAAANLKTKPYDLTVHAFQHDESYFIAVMTDGRGEMPAFKGKLTTQEMLNLVQYMRQLARDAQATQ